MKIELNYIGDDKTKRNVLQNNARGIYYDSLFWHKKSVKIKAMKFDNNLKKWIFCINIFFHFLIILTYASKVFYEMSLLINH